MGVFDELKMKSNVNKEVLENEENVNISTDFQKYKEVSNEVKRITKITNYKIEITKEIPNITDSKIGGVPYWDNTREYPKGKDGSNMILLVQINLDIEKFDKRLPQKGMLQFFVENNFVSKNRPYYKVIYHSSINENVSVDDVLKLGIKSCLDIDVSIIIENEYKIQFKKNKESISYCDEFDLQQVFRKAYKKLFNSKNDKFYDDWEIWNDNGYIIDDLSDGAGHKLFGYPHFCQYDIRNELGDDILDDSQDIGKAKSVNDNGESYMSWWPSASDMKKIEEEIKKKKEKRKIIYDTMILQLDSCKEFQWIDGGQVNFFIDKRDLKKLNFEDAIGNVDFY